MTLWKTLPRIAVLVLLAVGVAACGGRRAKHDHVQQAIDVPAAFDVTLLADKDSQFDFDGAPLTAEDLKSAFRYRQEENLPMSTVLLKRGEKQKIKSEHLIALARIAYEMKFTAYMVDDEGQIAEVRAQVKE